MQSRRQFLKNAALLSGSVGFWGALEGPIKKAMAIEPAAGSTFADAEHVVILMQENRSFDHAYGTLQGVRGYNDPRAIKLPDGNPVWVQSDAAGKRYSPFRLNIKDTRVTWMGSLPHSWASQVDARNQGRHDHWLRAKRSGEPEYAEMPLTLGHYSRDDIPFYYSLADAFTICDQHFCSSITPTMPNRRSAALPYELAVHGKLTADKTRFSIEFEAAKNQFGEKSAGAPFTVYARGVVGDVAIRNYAVSPGDKIEDSWALADFAQGAYHLQVYGPNGFFREFTGNADDPGAAIKLSYSQNAAPTGKLDGNLAVTIANSDGRRTIKVETADQSYGGGAQQRSIAPGETARVAIDTQPSHRWYDLAVSIEGSSSFRQRFAGRVETQEWSMTDPAMGRVETRDGKR